MNLTDVINTLVEDQGLDREKVISIVCDGVKAAYERKYPQYNFKIAFNTHSGKIEVLTIKTVSDPAKNKDLEISQKKALSIAPNSKIGDEIDVPFEEKIGRVEIATAKQVIALKIREIEQLATYEEFKDKKGTIISGTIHKRERRGVSIKIDDAIGFLPSTNSIPSVNLSPGNPIRVLVKEVHPSPVGGHQIILDRASAEFVKNLLEIEIPEIFEGIVEIKDIVRSPGYKTKIIVRSHSKEIDPIGTCVGVKGSRIKPILKDLGQEKIDLIEETADKEKLVKESLKPAEVDKVEIIDDQKATVWLADDQRSLAIGKMGQNISLASKLAKKYFNYFDQEHKWEIAYEIARIAMNSFDGTEKGPVKDFIKFAFKAFLNVEKNVSKLIQDPVKQQSALNICKEFRADLPIWLDLYEIRLSE